LAFHQQGGAGAAGISQKARLEKIATDSLQKPKPLQKSKPFNNSCGWPGHQARRRASRFCPAMTERLSPFEIFGTG
jgi:hypothetical protein